MHLVRRAIQQRPAAEREALELDFDEMLADDLDLFKGDVPIAEIVASICKGLGLDPDWTALARNDWDGVDLADRVALKGRGRDRAAERLAEVPVFDAPPRQPSGFDSG